MMNVVPIHAFSDNYIWAITNKNSSTFDCVDPGEAEPVIQFAELNQLQLRAILLTHHHHDHIGGVDKLIQKYPSCLVYGPDDPRIPHITKKVQKNQKIIVGNCCFKIIFNPGHTTSHISYYEPKQQWLFCGDTLFSAGCGRVFDGTMEQLHQSMQLFKTLPVTTKIFCGHEYTAQNLRFAKSVEPENQEIQKKLNILNTQQSLCSLPSSLDMELLINPFLRTDKDEVIAYALKHGSKSSESINVFETLRNQKNTFK